MLQNRLLVTFKVSRPLQHHPNSAAHVRTVRSALGRTFDQKLSKKQVWLKLLRIVQFVEKCNKKIALICPLSSVRGVRKNALGYSAQCFSLKDLRILSISMCSFSNPTIFYTVEVCGNGKLGFSVTTSLFMTLIKLGFMAEFTYHLTRP